MDLATTIIILGTAVGGILFILDKHIHNNTLQTRKKLLAKFREVKEKSILLQHDMEHSILLHDKRLLADFVCRDYLDTLKEKIEIEYSDSEYSKLKKTKLTKEKIIHYSEQFRYHQYLLVSLRQEYNQQIMQLNFKVI